MTRPLEPATDPSERRAILQLGVCPTCWTPEQIHADEPYPCALAVVNLRSESRP